MSRNLIGPSLPITFKNSNSCFPGMGSKLLAVHSYRIEHMNICADQINYIYPLGLSTMAINFIREHLKTVPINLVNSY